MLFKQTDVFEELRRVAMDAGVQQLAMKMGIPAGVLYGKLNQHDEHHKPTLADFVQILLHTSQLSPLASLCRQFNCAMVPLPNLSHLNDNALLEVVNRIHIEDGAVASLLNKALEDGRITANESNDLDKEIARYVAAILELKARIHFLAGLKD